MNLHLLKNIHTVALLLVLLTGCAAGPEPTATPTAAPTFVPVPTYTPTPEPVATALPAVTVETAFLPTVQVIPTKPPVDTPSSVLVATTVVSATAPNPAAGNAETQTMASTDLTVGDAATPTATPAGPLLTVSAPAVNVRSGPDTTFEIVGAANQGEAFELLARSADGGWWQVCCVNGQQAWIYGELAAVTGVDGVAVADVIPTPVAPTAVPVAAAPTAVPVEEPIAEVPATEAPAEAPAEAAPLPAVDPAASSAGDFNPDAQYQIVHFKVRGLGENNGGIRDSGAQHHIFLTVLDQNGNGVDGAVVENLVGEKGSVTTGGKGPGKAEITMYWEPFKLRVASDPSGPVTSQTSNQMGLAFPHLPDLVGKLGDETYEYGACPTIDIKCEWPIQAIHFSYEITFQKVK